MTQRKLKVLDLFSGIGGFSLGLESTGFFETAAFCEIEPFCQKVLKKHWPDVPLYEDVRTLTEKYNGEAVELICGGYPCQPFSHAGKRQGADDDRHLWPAMFDCIKKFRPTWVIGENVAGHINMGLDEVLSDLESKDYEARAFVIPACAVDAPHRRDRVWVVANTLSGRCSKQREGGVQQPGGTETKRSGKTLADTPQLHGYGSGEQSEQSKRQVSKLGERSSAEPLADADSDNVQGQQQECDGAKVREVQGTRQAGLCSGERHWLPEPDVGRVANGVPAGLARSGWLPEPGIGRVAKGIPDRVSKLKALGNAVVPQIPAMLGYAIAEAEGLSD